MTCVIANVLTGVIILGLLFAAEQPATEGSFALFTSIVYLGVPLAVISNLTTGPMLDRVSPKDLKYFAQGLNSACYNLANGAYLIPVHVNVLSCHSVIPVSHYTTIVQTMYSHISRRVWYCL